MDDLKDQFEVTVKVSIVEDEIVVGFNNERVSFLLLNKDTALELANRLLARVLTLRRDQRK
jgi:hypothetical protein